MKNLTITIGLCIFFGLTARASTGTAQYTLLPGSEFEGEAILTIKGNAAIDMFKDMKSSNYKAAAPDLESRHPSQISLNDCESRFGKNLTCKVVPRISKDGRELERNNLGKVIYDHVCFINFSNIQDGQIK